jgi:glycogen(starch) synthase
VSNKGRISALFVLWEVPPRVAGGAWTATYHLVRRLHEQDVDITVVTPWEQRVIEKDPFGVGIQPLGMGVVPGNASKPSWWTPWQRVRIWLDRNGPDHPADGDDRVDGTGVRGGRNPYHYSWRPLRHDPSLAPLRAEFTNALGRSDALDRFKEQRHRYIHAVDWVTFPSAAALSRQLGVPWVAHFHSVERERHQKRVSVIAAIEGWALRNAALSITPSEVTRSRLLADYGGGGHRVVVVPNPLSDGPKPGRSCSPGHAVSFVGRPSHHKGPDLFADVAEAVGRRDSSIEFRMYGSKCFAGTSTWRAENLHICGPVSWHDRDRVFERSRLVLMTSRHEPFGMVALEAMTSGVPVLYPRHAGVAEVIGHADSEIDPHNTKETAGRVLELLGEDDTKLKELADKQRQRLERYLASEPEQVLIAAVKAIVGP